jgi:hypothetical protein
MESVFSALANPDRLWIVMYLAAEGPTQAKDVAIALAKARHRAEIKSGPMSILVAPLLRAGVLRKDGLRDDLRLSNPEQVRRLITLASAISVATANESSQAANAQHAQLMRTITQVEVEQGEAPPG